MKVMSVAGAYWRGDENKQLIVFTEHLSLNKRFNRIPRTTEEAKRRDHRKLEELEVVCFFTKVGAGLPLWLPKELH
jgi:threonyl-tRNA synthetase